MKEPKPYHELRLVKNLKYRLVWQGALIGIVSGLTVSLYRGALSYAETFAEHLYMWVRTAPWLAGVVFPILLMTGIAVGYLTESEPMIKGSGIPQVEGQVMGFFHICWWKVLIKKFLGGVLAIGAGLSLGREGPSIQLGAATGEGLSKALRRDETEQRYLLTCGASAGLAAAFHAPLAGMMFALEEVHKNFSLSVLLSAMTSAVTADAVGMLFFGLNPVFDFGEISALPPTCYIALPLLGVILGVGGWLYNKVLLAVQKGYRKITFIKRPFVMAIPFLIAGIIGIFIPELLGGGHRIIQLLPESNVILSYLGLLLIGKFIFSMVSFGSGAPGGIFFPLLVLGALLGALFGQIAITYFGVSPQYYVNFLLLGMVGLFTGIVRAPVTGIILIAEMSGAPAQMLPLAIVVVIAYLTADLLKSKPIYESLLENMRHSHKESKESVTEKVLLNFAVENGSRADGKAVCELRWPDNCLVVSVLRGGEELIPRGETRIQAGDYVVIMCPQYEQEEYRRKIESKFIKKR